MCTRTCPSICRYCQILQHGTFKHKPADLKREEDVCDQEVWETCCDVCHFQDRVSCDRNVDKIEPIEEELGDDWLNGFPTQNSESEGKCCKAEQVDGCRLEHTLGRRPGHSLDSTEETIYDKGTSYIQCHRQRTHKGWAWLHPITIQAGMECIGNDSKGQSPRMAQLSQGWGLCPRFF